MRLRLHSGYLEMLMSTLPYLYRLSKQVSSMHSHIEAIFVERVLATNTTVAAVRDNLAIIKGGAY